MQEFDFKNFRKNIEEDLKEARSLVSSLSEFFDYPYGEIGSLEDEKKQFDEYTLSHYIERALLKLKFALEFLELDNLQRELSQRLSKYKTFHDEFEHVSYVGVFTNPVVDTIQVFVDALCSQLDPLITIQSKIDEENSLLERILIGTPKLISDSKLQPSNEAEIRNLVYRILIHVFPDTVREIPISKVSKSYKPDIGVRKLKAAVEYKFADSPEEVKKALGGIFEDIQGYSGSEDWKLFYAVIYQTDHFLTQSQVEEEFRLSNVPHNWKPIIVYGKGARRIRTKRSSVPRTALKQTGEKKSTKQLTPSKKSSKTR